MGNWLSLAVPAEGTNLAMLLCIFERCNENIVNCLVYLIRCGIEN